MNGEHSDLLGRATEEPLADGHGDFTPWNLLLGERWVFIDWDGVAAGTRLWDLAYSAQAFTLNDTSVDPNVAGQSLRAFVDGYRAEAELHSVIPEVLAQRTWAMYEMLIATERNLGGPRF
ncbi:aminoglycoside phosphotransferase family protein [Brevibacterium sp. JSBI002]|uniref:aminoglycoside phosphotransferase family protein n=1 Tax=Brevibacterium sp. JSBI002 TaxID=2886045 RepID=UPI002231D0F0|nr:aminoglycoside phosphotransferase family protein [Brevibacterium sp. JSBI002]UZD63439.1 aminoglycoside phosphotransferase family protein [Brevibacterium sp. JSBI002]